MEAVVPDDQSLKLHALGGASLQVRTYLSSLASWFLGIGSDRGGADR